MTERVHKALLCETTGHALLACRLNVTKGTVSSLALRERVHLISASGASMRRERPSSAAGTLSRTLRRNFQGAVGRTSLAAGCGTTGARGRPAPPPSRWRRQPRSPVRPRHLPFCGCRARVPPVVRRQRLSGQRYAQSSSGDEPEGRRGRWASSSYGTGSERRLREATERGAPYAATRAKQQRHE